MKIKYAVTDIYKDIMKPQNRKPHVVLQGGAGSSKSFSIAQDIIINRLVGSRNQAILVARKTLPSLRKSNYRDMVKILKEYHIYNYCSHNKTELTITYIPTFSYIDFASVDDPEKFKSTNYNAIWLEECTEFSEHDRMILDLRLRGGIDKDCRIPNQMYYSFNPDVYHHWIWAMEAREDVYWNRSTYRDNPFNSQEYIEKLEALINQNPTAYKVYTLGERAVLEGRIYEGWIPENAKGWENMPFDEIIYGLDFGYNNPAVLVEIGIKDNEYWLRQQIYETNLTISDLKNRMKEVVPAEHRQKEIIADSERPDAIEEIYQAGFNCKPAEKGKGSVLEGINCVKSQKIHYCVDDTDIVKEYRGYLWKKDREGNNLEEPIKLNDHAMDAIRYAIVSRGKQGAIIIGLREEIIEQKDHERWSEVEEQNIELPTEEEMLKDDRYWN